LLSRFPEAHDIEVHGAGIEEAFFALTADEDHVPNQPTQVQGAR